MSYTDQSLGTLRVTYVLFPGLLVEQDDPNVIPGHTEDDICVDNNLCSGYLSVLEFQGRHTLKQFLEKSEHM